MSASHFPDRRTYDVYTPNNKKKTVLVSPLGLFLGTASIAAGAYHGYCDAQGIPLQKENLEWALTYGPAIVQGSLGAVCGGLMGVLGRGVLGAALAKSKAIHGGVIGAAVGGIGGTAFGGTWGAAKGGIQTLIGYGIGYFAGYITK